MKPSQSRLQKTNNRCAATFSLVLSVLFTASQGLRAQAPESLPAPVPADDRSDGDASPSSPSSDGSKAAESVGSTFLGRDVPFFNPGNEIVSWDGKHWNINNNRIFQARFEKYLNAPEETQKEDTKYRDILAQILNLLAPHSISPGDIDRAFQMLPAAAAYEQDARLCDSLADAVYSAWAAQRNQRRLEAANAALEQEMRRLEWNAQIAGRGQSFARPRDEGSAAEWDRAQAQEQEMKMKPYVRRQTEIMALMVQNKAKQELSEVQAKIEFQALLIQLFLQRRFQHVLIGTRFYRYIFGDGDTKLKLGGDAKRFFDSSIGIPPTVGVLDSLANEAVRDVREGVQAFEYLLDKAELESATKRLAETFIIGEFLPEIRTLPREKKRQALVFSQKANQLISAIEVKDYALAEKLVTELEIIAKDFDNSKALAAVETARTVSTMHIAKARNAAVSGDRATLEAELKAATEIWPRNPALAEFTTKIFDQTDLQQQALSDLERLISQKNYRQIFEDRLRFIAAVALYPERQNQLQEILEMMQKIEAAMIRADEIARRGDYAGAWESAELAFKEFPDDAKLNQLRATLTTKAASFVESLSRARELEERDQLGSSLAWYLRAQRFYPPSQFAREGVERLVDKILPGV